MEPARRSRFLIEDAVRRLKEGEKTPAVYELWSVIRMLDREPRGEDRFWLVNALYHYGVALEAVELHQKSLDTFADCLARFGEIREEPTSHLIELVLFSAGVTAFGSGHVDDGIGYLERLID